MFTSPRTLYILSTLCLGLAVRWMLEDAYIDGRHDGLGDNAKEVFQAWDAGYAHGRKINTTTANAETSRPPSGA